MKKLLLASVLLSTLSINSYSMDIEAAQEHTIILQNGKIGTMGSNRQGQLGNSATSNVFSLLPMQSVKEITASGLRSAALLADTVGTVALWGQGISPTPVDIINLPQNVKQISMSSNELYILLADGTVWYGWNTDFSTFSQVFGLSNVKQISAKGMHMLALDNAGNAYGFGGNGWGQLGTGDFVSTFTDAVLINGPTTSLPKFKEVIAGEKHSLAIDIYGQLYSFGNGYQGRLGHGSDWSNNPTPTAVAGLSNVVAADAGYNQSLAVTSDNRVWAFGFHDVIDNTQGVYNQSSIPIEITLLRNKNINKVIAGGDHSYAISDTDNFHYGWGGNRSSKLTGDGDTTELHVPTAVAVLDNPSTFGPAPTAQRTPDGTCQLIFDTPQDDNIISAMLIEMTAQRDELKSYHDDMKEIKHSDKSLYREMKKIYKLMKKGYKDCKHQVKASFKSEDD